MSKVPYCYIKDKSLFFQAVKGSFFPFPKPKLKKKKSEPFVKSDYTQKVRLRIIEAYGGKCVCCGENLNEFMTIDHIFGDGKQDREKHGSGLSFYRHLERLGYPKDRYRLLCMNCNFVRRFGKDCPHNSKSHVAWKHHGMFRIDLSFFDQPVREQTIEERIFANVALPWPETESEASL